MNDETMALVSEQFDALAERLAEVRLALAREMAQRVQALETQVEHLTVLSGTPPPPPAG